MTSVTELPQGDWRKSTHSDANEGSCVEVAVFERRT
jgi:hypothetical protein